MSEPKDLMTSSAYKGVLIVPVNIMDMMDTINAYKEEHTPSFEETQKLRDRVISAEFQLVQAGMKISDVRKRLRAMNTNEADTALLHLDKPYAPHRKDSDDE